MQVFDFDALVEMLNFAYSLSLIMEFAAFIKLRITDDDGRDGLFDVLYTLDLFS